VKADSFVVTLVLCTAPREQQIRGTFDSD